ERYQILSGLISHGEALVERDSDGIAAALLISPRAGVIDEYTAHDARGDGKKVRAVLPRDVLRGNQPQIGLIDERRRLQTVPDGLMTDVLPRDAMELVVDQRDQSIERALVPLAPFEEQSGDFGLRGRQGLILGPFALSSIELLPRRAPQPARSVGHRKLSTVTLRRPAYQRFGCGSASSEERRV